MGFPRHQAGYYVYVPKSKKLYCSADVAFDEHFTTPVGTNDKSYKEALGHHLGKSLHNLNLQDVLSSVRAIAVMYLQALLSCYGNLRV